MLPLHKEREQNEIVSQPNLPGYSMDNGKEEYSRKT
jgi:hypothetical protein